MPLRPDMKPDEFLEILRRRKWVIVFSVLLVLFGATVYCVLTQDLYQSTMRILIIPPAVSEGMVRSTANVDYQDRLKILQQDIFGTARLMAVINEQGLFRGSPGKVSADAMVAEMRKRINMEIGRNNTFTLSFDHENPQTAKDVVSRLGSFFIGENIKSREATVQETSRFLEGQVQETRKRLEEQEERIKRYKLQFGGELPQQMQVNLSQLARLQDQIKNNSESVARLEDRKIFLESQIRTMESQITAAEYPAEVTVSGSPAGDTDYLLAELALRRKKLEELNSRYTPLHPAVVQARWEVEKLEAKIEVIQLEAKKGESGSAGGTRDNTASGATPDFQRMGRFRGEANRLREQVGTIDLDITALKRESASAARQIERIQLQVERLPQREQEMIALTRDYDNIKRSYEELLRKKLEANISENLEEKQKGERFQVIDPANLPSRPIKPDRLKVLALALMASLVIGAGGAIVLEVLDPTLRGSRDFRNFFDLPVLASLPLIQDDRYKRQYAVRRAAVVGGLVSIAGAYLAFLVMHGEKVKAIVRTIGGVN